MFMFAETKTTPDNTRKVWKNGVLFILESTYLQKLNHFLFLAMNHIVTGSDIYRVQKTIAWLWKNGEEQTHGRP